MAVKIKHKRGTAANIGSANPTLASGELGFETDTLRFKLGDGTTAWDSLAYVNPYVSTTDRLLGRSTAGAGVVEEITCTAFGRSLIDDADAAAARTTLGVQPTASPAFTGAATFANTGDVVPLTVTNAGTANSFVVNDASGDTSPFVVDASGNVGIGGAPSSPCHIKADNVNDGVLHVEQDGTGSASVRCDYDGTGARSWIFGAAGSAYRGGGYGGEFFLYDETATAERLRISSTGTATFAGQVLVTAGSVSACSVAPTGDPNTGLVFPSADVVTLVTNGSERVRVDASGKLRIASTANFDGYFAVNNGTNKNIQLRGSIRLGGSSIQSIQDNAASDSPLEIYCGSSQLQLEGAPITFFAGGAERVRVDASGNVTLNNDASKRIVFFTPGSTYALNSSGGAAIRFEQVSSDDEIAFETHDFGASHAERMRIKGDGSITMPDVYGDTVGATNRDLFIDNTGLIGYVSSIRESKTDIVTLDDVSWLSALSPVSYRYRKQDSDGNYTDEADGVTDYGLIAEDVEGVKPELCFYDMVDGEPQLRGVTYSKLITPMLRYIQQLEARIAALEERING